MKLKLFLLCCCSTYLLQTLGFGFSQPKQESLNSVRERTGRAVRVRFVDRQNKKIMFSEEDKGVLRKITIASEQRKWAEVQSHFARYHGDNIAIYNAVMNAALRCGKYLEGASIYDKCRKVCDETEEPTFVAALRIFGKLQRKDRVREIWQDALEQCELSLLLASARIHAAADEGDVESAAEMLDLLSTNKLKVDVIAITSAIRSCWGWGKNRHRAAKYFFDLLPSFSLKPNIVTFTSLVGSYQEAPLEDLISARAEMKGLNIEADRVFAETYVTIMLQQKFKHLRDVGAIVDAIRDKDVKRLHAARMALAEFESEGVELTALCQNLKNALGLLKH